MDKEDKISINQIVKRVMTLAEEKGFGTSVDEVNTYEKIALIHSEVSEAMEAYRRKKMNGKDGFAEELADSIIRILHLVGVHGIDIEKEILKKMEYNENRDWRWNEMNETSANNI